MPNHLSTTSSPYLLQHKDNPVEWYPWGSEALEKAKREAKPIFLSIGYSACHWCHVMESESFSDPKVAAILNESFVSIKVDREERPDLDHIYMQAVQVMSGSGGWPLNVFLTPDLRPFYGGTYFPPDGRFGRPPFIEVLKRIAQIFYSNYDEVKKQAAELTAVLVQMNTGMEPGSGPSPKIDLRLMVENTRKSFDREFGGLGAAPKFFYSDALRLALRWGTFHKDSDLRDQALHSLKQMMRGGVYDQIEGGFHRYSTDEKWIVPHFEKMLYDNALLARAFLEAFLATGDKVFESICVETLEWASKKMKSRRGTFYSSIDADSEHEEGKFYSWTEEEIKGFFGSQSLISLEKFEDRKIITFAKPPSYSEREEQRAAFQKLLALRSKRIAPSVDTKIQTSWNGLMISAFARAGSALNHRDFVRTAAEAADQVWADAYREGKLRHLPNAKESFLEDLSFFGEALLDVFLVTADDRYFKRAEQLGFDLIRDFYDSEAGGFWATPKDQADLLTRYKDFFDGALPSPFQMSLSFLRRLSHWSGEKSFYAAIEKSQKVIEPLFQENLGGFHRLGLSLFEEETGGTLVCVLPTEEEKEILRGQFSPWIDYLIVDSAIPQIPQLEGATLTRAFYLCKDGRCLPPEKSLAGILAEIQNRRLSS